MYFKSLRKIFINFSLFIFFAIAGVSSVFAQGNPLNWDYPVQINKSDGRFPVTINNGTDSYVFWQKVNSGSKTIQLMVRHYTGESVFRERQLFGTFDYSGEVPDLYTVAMSKSGTIIVAAPSAEGVTIFTSRDKCETFFKKVIRTSKTVVGPKVYVTSDGRFRLFYSLVPKKTPEKKVEVVTEDKTEESETAVENLEAVEKTETAAEETKVETEEINNESFQLCYIDSYDGQTWTDEKQLEMPEGVKNPFAPFLIPTSQGDLVVFQAQRTVDGLSHYQLYKTLFTGSSYRTPDVLRATGNFAQAQRPVMFRYNGVLYISWEESQNALTNIYISEISEGGVLSKSKIENIRDSLNNKELCKKASRGRFFTYEEDLYFSWFDANNKKLFLVKLITKEGQKVYEEIDSLNVTSGNLFPNPLILKKADGSRCLYFICQKEVGSTGRISILGPDRSVGLPTLVPKSYRAGKRSAKYDVEIDIKFPVPADVSGIKGYVYYWGLDSETEPEINMENLQVTGIGAKSTTFKNRAEEDGIYTLKVRIADNAGNWSTKSVGIDYYHDITPPSKPVINPDSFDSYGFAKDNTFNIKWFASKDENKREGESEKDAAGYTYELEYLGNIPDFFVVNKTHKISMSKARVEKELQKIKDKYRKQLNKSYRFKPVIETSGISSKKYINYKNGVYRFSIAAIDEVGNISDSTSELIFVNKFQPQTAVYSVSGWKTKTGEIIATINGEAFKTEGTITKVYFDADGKLNKNGHYDLELSSANNEFKVSSDKTITDIKIGTALQTGTKYKVGVYHSDRGLYFSDKFLNLNNMTSGTVVYNPEYEYKQKYHAPTVYIVIINFIIVVLLVALVIMIVLAFVFVFTVYTKEKLLLNKEVNSLITGDVMPSLKEKTKKNRQRSLRGKIVGFTFVLIILIVGIITAINVKNTLENQGKTLSDSLLNRIDVLLGSIDSGVTSYMPDTELEDEIRGGEVLIDYSERRDNATSNIVNLISQRSALEEARYITILGKKDKLAAIPDKTGKINYVWATNDDDQDLKFENKDPDSNNQFVNGVTQVVENQPLNNDLYTILQATCDLDESVKNQTKEISDEISRLKTEFLSDPVNFTKQTTQKELEAELTNEYTRIENENSGSVPPFTGITLDMNTKDYLFYRPVIYRPLGEQTSESKVFNGLVVLSVNVENLQNDLANQVKNIIISGLIIALISIIVGVVGAWVLAGIIVRPIKKLETHIQDVGNLLTKSARERMRLQKMEIKITSKDEVGRLGEVVNKMSSTVGKAAEDELLEADGKVVQQKFIPLEDGEGKYKLPIVKHTDEKVELYAFYKGNSDVSGDYFDYQKLDDRWYVFIKCDVSGHGTPAALLVSVLSTKFREYYYNSKWDYAKNGVNLVQFVSEVNDFIYDLGTRGKFSTINISLYNKDTGELYTCNAGDNKLDIFESDKRRLRRVTLANTPAAGGVSTDLVQMKGGFRIEKTMLRHGDTLFMYSDGIDEAERLVRNKDYSVKTHVVETKKFNPRENKEEIETSIEDLKEQFGEERYRKVVEAVMNRRKFILDKEENPTKEILEFNFTNCKGTLDEAIIALASIERVFRMYKSPEVKASDEIEIEKLLDQFLKEHFELYTTYCKPAVKVEEEKTSKKKNRKNKTEIVSTKKADEDLNVTRYGYVFEDKQADDITLVAIHRP